MSGPEAFILRDVLAAWGNHPRLRIARINTGAAKLNGQFVRFNPPGTADIVGLIAPSGRMLMIECKAPRGAQSPEQVTMQRIVEKFGGLYVLARSVADVDQALAAVGVTR